jgi:hypothetical protein
VRDALGRDPSERRGVSGASAPPAASRAGRSGSRDEVASEATRHSQEARHSAGLLSSGAGTRWLGLKKSSTSVSEVHSVSTSGGPEKPQGPARESALPWPLEVGITTACVRR